MSGKKRRRVWPVLETGPEDREVVERGALLPFLAPVRSGYPERFTGGRSSIRNDRDLSVDLPDDGWRGLELGPEVESEGEPG